jgi:hypothetical protein
MSKISEVSFVNLSSTRDLNRKEIYLQREIKEKLIAVKRDKNFFDGERKYGYGGFVYDGRNKTVAENLVSNYRLGDNSKVLQVQCEKGFLLYELQKINSSFYLIGTETSEYAIKNKFQYLNCPILNLQDHNLPFSKHYFDLIVVIGYAYTLSLQNFVQFIHQCNNLSRNVFLTLATYDTPSDYFVLRKWSLLGNLIFLKQEWLELLDELNFNGEVEFISAHSLGLI